MVNPYEPMSRQLCNLRRFFELNACLVSLLASLFGQCRMILAMEFAVNRPPG